MGSIQVFPGKPAAAGRPPRWQPPPAPGTAGVRVREARLEDFTAVRAVQRKAAPWLPASTLKQLESRRTAFAEGQLIAESGGQVVAVAHALIVAWERHGMAHDWRSITGEGSFTTHEPAGESLYAAEILVDESRGGFGAARALLQAQRRLCRRKNLKRLFTTARLAAYADYRESMGPDEYARRVLWGDVRDPWLRFALSQGFQYCGVVEGYLPEDAASGGHAALLAWLNPLHSPLGPPAFIQADDRARKCA